MSRTKTSAEESATLARTIGVGSDAKAYDSITDMIADPNIHALWVCSPNFARVETFEEIANAISSGKGELLGVTCEKPLGRNVEEAKKVSLEPVDLDMLGAIGATMMDLGFTPEAIWSIIAITRSFAAGAHYIEEVEREGFTKFGETLTPKEVYDGPEDRPVPTLKDRAKYAKSAQTHSLKEWSDEFS